MDFSTLADDIDFLCGTDSTSYALADKARNMNRHYYMAIIAILKADERFQFDDRNFNTRPVSSFTLVDGQQDYSLPTDLLKLTAIEVEDASGNWVRLTEIDKSELTRTISSFDNVNGMPQFYDIDGDSVLLYPAPATGSVTLLAGGRMHYSRDVDAFVSGDTTQKPGIPTPFHSILSLGASYDWCLVNGPEDKADRYKRDEASLIVDLVKYHQSKNKDSRNAGRIQPAWRVEHAT